MLKWFETVDIVERESELTRRKAESVLAELSENQRLRHEQDEVDALESRQARTKLSSNWLEAQLRVKAADELKKAGLDISESNISYQIRSGGIWAQEYAELARRASQADREAKVREDAEDWVRWEVSQVGGNWAKDYDPDKKQAMIEAKTQELLAERYPEEYGPPQPVEQEEIKYDRPLATGWSTLWDKPRTPIQPIPGLTDYTYDPNKQYPRILGNITAPATPSQNIPPVATNIAPQTSNEEQLKWIDYRRRLIAWAKEQGIADPEGYVANLMATKTGEVTMGPQTGETKKLPKIPTFADYQAPEFIEQFVRGIGLAGDPLRTLQLYTKKEVVEVLGQSLTKLPEQLGASILQATQGQGGASVVNRDWADVYIKEANEDIDKFTQDVVSMYPNISVLREVSQLSRNLAYSITSMGAGLAVGVPVAFIPLPGARVAAWAAGTAASGFVAYQMTTYQIMQQYLELKNEEKIQQTGRGLTLEEENQLKVDFHSKAVKYGLWEAVPEAISNLLFAQILVGPLGQIVGGSMATKILTKIAGIYGEELLTETITQKGQSDIEVVAGLRAERINLWEAFKEIAPQTFLLTTVMAGAGQTIISSSQAIKKATTSLKNEIGEEHPLYEEIKEGIETGELKPEVTPKVEPAMAEGETVSEGFKTQLRQASSEEYSRLLREAGLEEPFPGMFTKAEVTPEIPTEGKIIPETGKAEVAETAAAAEWETTTVETGEGEVTVEGLEPIRNIRRIDTRFREKQATYAQTKKQLTDYVNEHLPLAVRGKMLAAVKNVKTDLGLTSAIAQADRYAEQYAQKTLKTKITNELKKIIPTKTAGMRYGRFTADVQGQLNQIKKNTQLDRENAKGQILQNIEAAEKGEITYEQADDANEILAVSGLNGMSSSELAYTLQYIKTLKTTGRGIRVAAREAEDIRINALRENITNILTGGKGIKPGVGTVSTRGMEARESKVKSFLTNWQYGMDDVLDKISKFDKTSKPFESIISKLGSALHLARSTQSAGEIHYFARVADKVKEIYNTKGRRELNDLLDNLTTEEINLGTFETTDGKQVTLTLTKDQIIEKYMQLQDPTLEETFRIGMKWSDEMISAVRDSMTSEDLQYAQWILNFYQEYGKTIKPTFEAKFHIPFPENPNYSPINRDLETSAYEHILLARDNYRYAGVTSNSLKARIKNRVALRFNGATEVLANHIVQMEHFKAFSASMKEARRVFGDKNIRTAIRQYHGQDILKHIDKHLNDIARDGVDRANLVREVDKLRRRFTLATLGIKPAIAVKQAFSLPAYLTYEQMPIGDFFEGVANFWKNPIANSRKLKELSGYFAERWGRGHERDIRLVKEKGIAGKLSNTKNWRDLLMLGIHKVDTITTQAGSWAVYRSMKKQGLSDQEATTHAEIATKRSQPSFGVEDMAALRKGGSFLQLATMFQSQPNKYYRIVANSIRNIQYGRGSKARATLNIMLAWWILPALFQYVSDAFQWKKEHQIRVAVLGPANFLLAAGQLLQSAWGWITNEPFGYQPSPVFDTFNELQWAIQGTVKMFRDGQDPMKEIDTEYLIKTIEHYIEATGQFTGIPTPYAVQVERAIRNADIRQMIFSDYALRSEGEAVGKLRDIYARDVCGEDSWKDLTPKQQEYFYILRPDLK